MKKYVKPEVKEAHIKNVKDYIKKTFCNGSN